MTHQNYLSFDNLYFLDALAFNFLKAKNFMVENFKKVEVVKKFNISLLGIKKGYQSYYLYITNDIQWVLLLKLLCLCITLPLLSNCFVSLLPVCLLELKPSNSSLNFKL